MSFQKIILTIATILLIIILIVIGVTLSKSSDSDSWPPIVGECPDYWIDMSGNGQQCVNTHNLGTCNTATMNFDQAPYNSSDGTCAKYKWANACGITWDGITYGAKNPCDMSTMTS